MTQEELLCFPTINRDELTKAILAALCQTRIGIQRFSNEFKHIFSTNGFYTAASNDQWTNGFWTGQLWLAFEFSHDSLFSDIAMEHIKSFRNRIENRIETDTHDLGFLYSPSCVAGYKLTADNMAKETALMAADMLLERFHEKGQFLQAWGSLNEPGNYRLIIDCLLNLPLLYWASEETGNPIYAQKATAHAKTALNVLIRSDSSTYHTFYFDPNTGIPVRGVTHQGYSSDSAWSRGQAWGIYGIALNYRYTKSPEYILLFEKVTHYFLSHLPQNLIPYWDFVFTDGCTEPRDSSAAAIAACGMLEMAKFLSLKKSIYYSQCASKLIQALFDCCAVKDSHLSDGVLLHGVYGRKTPYNDCIDHGIDECNLWGDYFYMEALRRLWSNWNPYW